MPADPLQFTRQDFPRSVAGTLLLSQGLAAQPPPGKVLLVVAHPDDEYAFAGAVYHLVREEGWSADQVVITDGEAGYRYASLAAVYYGVELTGEREGRAHLREIRKHEVLRGENPGHPQALRPGFGRFQQLGLAAAPRDAARPADPRTL